MYTAYATFRELYSELVINRKLLFFTAAARSRFIFLSVISAYGVTIVVRSELSASSNIACIIRGDFLPSVTGLVRCVILSTATLCAIARGSPNLSAHVFRYSSSSCSYRVFAFSSTFFDLFRREVSLSDIIPSK